jgi:hypothetical protein
MIKIEHNVETGEIKEIRFTQEEIAEVEAAEAAAAAKLAAEAPVRAEAEAAKAAAEAKLAALGLTSDDLKALGL